MGSRSLEEEHNLKPFAILDSMYIVSKAVGGVW